MFSELLRALVESAVDSKKKVQLLKSEVDADVRIAVTK